MPLRTGMVTTESGIPAKFDWVMKRRYNRRGKECADAYEVCISTERTDDHPRLGGDRDPHFLWSDDLGEDAFFWEPLLDYSI